MENNQTDQKPQVTPAAEPAPAQQNAVVEAAQQIVAAGAEVAQNAIDAVKSGVADIVKKAKAARRPAKKAPAKKAAPKAAAKKVSKKKAAKKVAKKPAKKAAKKTARKPAKKAKRK